MFSETKSGVEDPLTKRERAYRSIELLFDGIIEEYGKGYHEEVHDLGDVEYEEGELEPQEIWIPGKPDMEKFSADIESVAKELDESTQNNILAQVEILKTALKEGDKIDFKTKLKAVKDAILNHPEQDAEINELAGELDSFINDNILSRGYGSKERGDWGFALKNYRDTKNPDHILSLLRQELAKKPDEEMKIQLNRFVALLNRD